MSSLGWMARAQDRDAALLENRTRVLAVTAGRGSDSECAYCHKSIAPTSIEHRIQAIVLGRLRVLNFHRICHHLWESHEQEQGGEDGHSPPSMADAGRFR